MKFYATERHYLDHLLPIYKAIENKSTFFCGRELKSYALQKGVNPEVGIPKGLTVVSSYMDLNDVDEAVMMEHGSGQTYKGVNCGSYANSSTGKDKVKLYLAVNNHSARAFKKFNPKTPVKVIGCPKLDSMLNIPAGNKVAISFHWDCKVVPETMSAFWHYKDVLGELSEEFELIGHGHPRIIEFLRSYYEKYDIEVVESFESVAKRAGTYICDNSSTIYEMAALGRPVILLNTPMYRKHVEHGIRFWEYANVGIQVEDKNELVSAIKRPDKHVLRRKLITEKLYPYLGRATEEAVKWLLQL